MTNIKVKEAATAEQKLMAAGVFKGADGLRKLAECQEFWDEQSYGTRLYFGTGIADYLHRDVLRTAVAALDRLAVLEQAVEAVPGWQDIATAPKDGTTVLIANDSPGSVHPREGYYVMPERRYENEPTHAGWWRLAGSSETAVHGRTPTHWQPMPASPLPAPKE